MNLEALPFSRSCENNKDVILNLLLELFADRREVLEIASGTGQHACYFAAGMPWLRWQPTELPEHLQQLQPRCNAYERANLLPAKPLDVRASSWLGAGTDAVFTANSLHIMAAAAVEKLFAGLASGSTEDVLLAIYGPFNYGGQYTSPSNARFDQWLALQHPDSAIRDFEDIERLATRAGFVLQADHEMPANNRLLLWRKT